jgi:dihydrofolate reductase
MSKEWRSIIIGGGEIYKQSLEFADKIEITKVLTSPDADTFFQLLLRLETSIRVHILMIDINSNSHI